MLIRQALRAVITASLASFLFMAGVPGAQASVVISSTRVIYDAQEAEVTVRLLNQGSVPTLVQTWIDRGQTEQQPSNIDVPFVVTPPISRIDPSKGQTLRIAYTGEPLPRDKESVFWLNVLEVPPKVKDDNSGKGSLQLAFHSRIKLFYRPADLKGKPEDAPAALSWRYREQDGKPGVEAYDPTAYHVSFGRIEVSLNGRSAACEDGGMVNPGEHQWFPLSAWKPGEAATQVRYMSINDLGGAANGTAPLVSTSPSPSP
jgi:P pilus assembly chaperone PapD